MYSFIRDPYVNDTNYEELKTHIKLHAKENWANTYYRIQYLSRHIFALKHYTLMDISRTSEYSAVLL